ncbi:urease accessory protein UreD [Micromonospora sp. HUAS LYJ1]|uniref:urease accessory protein UreD n=1 Tax=Micromonospora sp. HUAS LYJ1 TaxID=3061626 RepID=UPI002673FBC7|nr:urease accessory protein UreD [Micromonospora sp. HUAS LYJ1]WKU06193.1 urease accessory protein UreD [Micromonospora sp. HUAS LYJ1]
MRAVARVVAVADSRGRTVLRELRGESPLLLRQAAAEDGVPTVYVVGGAAGPLAGDDLRLSVEVGPGAAVRVRTVAASVALPGPAGAVSRMRVDAVVHRGGTLDWLPEQLVASAGCDHVAESRVTLAEGARLLWREELVCGRYGEPAGDVVVATSVDHAGRPLLRQSLAVGPAAPGWAGPAVLGGATATGSLLVVGPAAASGPATVDGGGQPRGRVLPTGPGASAAWLPLAGGPAALLTATAADAHTLRTLLTSPAGTHTPPGEEGPGEGPRRPTARTGVDAVPVA